MALLPDVLKLHRIQLGLLRHNRTLVLVLLLIACIGGIVLPFIRTSTCDVANLAFAQAKMSPVTIRNLGMPLQRGLLAFGDLELHGSQGEASLSLPIYGQYNRGILCVDGVRFNGNWQLISLDLEIAGRPGRLNLMPIQSTIPR